MKYNVAVILTVNVPGATGSHTDVVRQRVTNALSRMVDPMNSGIAIHGASIEKIERDQAVLPPEARRVAAE